MTLYELHARPALDRPVLVIGMEGWIDAGLGAATAIATLQAAVTTERVASFDTDSLLDHRARRPVVRIVDGVNTGLRWPEIELRGGHDGRGHDLLLLAGPEPDHSWHAFTAAVGDLAQSFGVPLVIGLGAFPAPVPHTRPARVVSTATTQELAQRVGFLPGSLDVPAGVQAALERTLADRDIPAVGLWARVPHYAAAMPYPEASAVLLEALNAVAGIEADTSELRRAADASRQHLDQLIANSEEHIALVRQLETQVDADVPSGDEIAAEVERFLRGEGA
jgi:proteasome assembly chaperone (PAC2) family protein